MRAGRTNPSPLGENGTKEPVKPQSCIRLCANNTKRFSWTSAVPGLYNRAWQCPSRGGAGRAGQGRAGALNGI